MKLPSSPQPVALHLVKVVMILDHEVLNVEVILKCFILILRQYDKQTGNVFFGPPSCKSSSSRTSVAVAQLLSSPHGSPCGRSHHIQLCSGLRLKSVSPCLIQGGPAAALVVKICLKQLVVLQDEPVFFPFRLYQHLPPSDFFCCLIFQIHSSKTQTHLLCSQPKQCCFLFMTYHIPCFWRAGTSNMGKGSGCHPKVAVGRHLLFGFPSL